MATAPTPIPLRFQRSELEAKADLSPEGLALLDQVGHPEKLVDRLIENGNSRDAMYVLALLLPHRQAVWWGCLCVHLTPDLDRREDDLAALRAAEKWVQVGGAEAAERAGELANAGTRETAAAWVATAAYWAGATIAPRGQQPVAPAPHLTGVATRTALLLLTHEPALLGRLDHADLLTVGRELMKGGNGGVAQTALRDRLAQARTAQPLDSVGH